MYYSVLQHVNKKCTVWLPVITTQFDHAVLLNWIDHGQAGVNMVMNPWGP
jgi:hypothetical protein